MSGRQARVGWACAVAIKQLQALNESTEAEAVSCTSAAASQCVLELALAKAVSLWKAR